MVALAPGYAGAKAILEAFMAISAEMRRLQNKWVSGAGWPKRLEWLEIDGGRGWG